MRRVAAAEVVAIVTIAATVPAGAQSLGDRVRAADGAVQVVYPSRPAACGDGRNLIGNVLDNSIYYQDSGNGARRGGWDDRLCVHGPARVVATVADHEIVSIRVYVGPLITAGTSAFNVSARDAASWLADLVQHENSRVASDAMLPLMIADDSDPWPALLRVARDDARPRAVRTSAMMWLAAGVNLKLGLSHARTDTDDDEVRRAAVFALSQRPHDESVPELLDLAANANHPAARREAIFWLGQSGDRRAADLFAGLLGLR